MTKAIIRRNRVTAYLFLLPNIVGFLIFVFLPVLFAVGISFTDWDGFQSPNFTGVKNYIDIFTSSKFLDSMLHTVVYTFFSVPFTLALAILIAVAMNSKIVLRGFFRTVLFIPNMAAIVAVAIVWRLIFHPEYGPLNQFLMALGFANPPRWFGASNSAMAGVIIVSIWHKMGYYMVIFLAGLQGIPKQLYESADIDGAGGIRKFFSITLPMLSPTIFFASVIAIIDSFKVFSLVYVLTRGGPGRATAVMAFTIYQEAFDAYKWGSASAMSFVLFLIIIIITIIQFRGQKKWVSYYSL